MYSFWYNAPTLLPTGATVEMERKICYISLVAYTVVLVMHGHTNVKSALVFRKNYKAKDMRVVNFCSTARKFNSPIVGGTRGVELFFKL